MTEVTVGQFRKEYTDIRHHLITYSNPEETIKKLDYYLTALKNRYAPTIYISEQQAEELEQWHLHMPDVLADLPKVVNQGSDGAWSMLDELAGRLFNHSQGKTTPQEVALIMQALQFPETVKIKKYKE